jgi:hypothetical protein
MPWQPSILHDVKVAIADGLALRPGLAGVQIATAWLGEESARESIQLRGRDRSTQDWASIGRLQREENLTIEGVIWVVKGGKDESVIREARGRAFELYAEIEEFVRVDPSLDDLVKQIETVALDLDEGIHLDGGRYAELSFSIEAMQRLRTI